MAATYSTNQRTFSMRRMAYYLAAAVVTAAGLVLTASPAHANIPVTCSGGVDAGWYVNDDEGALAPTWTADGLVFDGHGGLVHHAVASSLGLADLTPGTFTQTNLSGALPLLKYETSTPYSTVNQTASGKFWSSNMDATQQGGQDQPVDSPADLIGLSTKAGKSPYTADTTVGTFGIGYASDQGNADTITSLTFAGATYSFTPCPVPPAPPAAGGGATPSHRPSPTPTHAAATGTPSARRTQAGAVAGGVTPAATPSSGSPAPSDSSIPLTVVPATTDPGFSVGPVVPEQVTPMVKASGSSNAGYFIGGGLVLAVVAVFGVVALRRRRNAPHDIDETAIMPRHGSGEQS